MGEPVDGIPKLDHAIRNGLLLSLVSLAAGDRVGLFAFDSRIRNWLPPRNGVTSFASFQRACSALDYGNDETNFTLGLADLSTRLTRRSLIIVFTDFVDTITAGLMVEQLTRMRQRHLIIFVALGDPWLEQTATQTVADTKSLQAAVVAHDLSNDRKRVHRELDRRGISSIDVTTAELGPAVIDRYLTIKRRGLL